MQEQLRILLVGSDAGISIENIYRRAFMKAGGTAVDFFVSMPWKTTIARSRILNRLTLSAQYALAGYQLEKHLKRNRKKYDLIIVFKGMEFSRAVLENARRAAGNAVWININPDDPYNVLSRGSSNSNVVESIDFYDGYGIWSKSILSRLNSSGCRSPFYLPFAYDPELHYPDKKQVPRQNITFFGSWDPERESILSQLSDMPVDIYGNSWNRIRKESNLSGKIRGTEIQGEQLRMVMSSSLLSLNLLRPQNAGSHNMRTFEIPAMGAMMLSTRTEEQLEFFEEGKEAEYFESPEELSEKIRFYLDHPREAEKIALAGYSKCMSSGCSYEHRAQQLITYYSKQLR